MGRLRIPPVLRTPLLIICLALLHLLAARAVEAVRLPWLRALSAPLTTFGLDGTGEFTPPTPEARLALSAQAERALQPFGDQAQQTFPVLDLSLERGFLILGGGTELGLGPGMRVSSPEGCVGILDRVTKNLARVRLLIASGAEIPVECRREAGNLPGGMDRLVAILEGDGENVVVSRTHLPQAFEVGDTLTALGQADALAPLVGEVIESGLRPKVRLFAQPEGQARLLVEGARSIEGGESSERLFEALPLRTLLVGRGTLKGALLSGVGAEDLLPGCAVESEGRYLGRVVKVALGYVFVVRPGGKGRRLAARLIREDGTSASGELLGLHDGVFATSEGLRELPEGERLLVLTAGGQELVPEGLIVGTGEIKAGKLVIANLSGFPEEVIGRRFRFGAQRRRLRERSR